MPPIIGYAAASGILDAQAWTLFAILFLWQFPHFLAIAWMYREDYERAGIRMLPSFSQAAKPPRGKLCFTRCADSGEHGAQPARHVREIYFFGALALGLWYLYSGVRVPSIAPFCVPARCCWFPSFICRLSTA